MVEELRARNATHEKTIDEINNKLKNVSVLTPEKAIRVLSDYARTAKEISGAVSNMIDQVSRLNG